NPLFATSGLSMDRPSYEAAFAGGVDVISVGRLHVPSGQLVACDPYFCASASPYIRRVRPGDYEVSLRQVMLSEWGPRIACARLLIDETNPLLHFERATTERDTGTYVVESGVASFMDEFTRIRFASVLAEYYRANPRGNYYSDVLASEFEVNPIDRSNVAESR